MDWVKTAMYASIAWCGMSLALGIGLVWYVTSHPMGHAVDKARFAKAGELTGYLMGTGVGATWFGLYAWSELQARRAKRKKKRRPPGEPRVANR